MSKSDGNGLLNAIIVKDGRIEDALKRLSRNYSKEIKTEYKEGRFFMTHGQKRRRQLMRSKARLREKIRIDRLRGDID